VTTHAALVTIPMTTAITEDTCTNTWHFQIATPVTADYVSIIAALKSFYDAWATHRSQAWDVTNARIRFYKLTDPKPRAPVYDALMGLSTSKGTDRMPAEVSVCMSYQGIRASGQSQARRRNRIYCGPFATNVLDGTAGKVSTVAKANIVGGAQGLLIASNAATAWKWTINSSYLPEDGSQFVNVNNGWVDDAFDIQRRRGIDPQSRVAFS